MGPLSYESSPCYFLITLGKLVHKEKKNPAFQDVLMPVGIRTEQRNALLLPGNITLCWNQRIFKNREINPGQSLINCKPLAV